MKLKLNNLKGLLSTPCTYSIKLTLLVFLLSFATLTHAQIPEAQLRKDAEQLFEEEDYTKAYKLYAQLVSNHPTDPLYNYRLGVCMIYSEPDKKKSFSYLNKAYQNKDFLPKDVCYYIGKAYHINYLFDEAIRFYNEFKKDAPSSLQKKLQVDREIKACNNGKRLLSALTDLEIITKKQLNESDYFRSYDLASIGGKLLLKPEDFKTSADKKQKDKSIIYLPKSGERVFFSSYGKDKINGKDIYYRERLPNGQFSEAKRIDAINTEFDEDYPFLHPNGKTLYFASKGHNSMGGYDIFKTNYIESTNSWTQPENLEFPINSPDDDYLFVTDSAEKIAFFSTARYSPPGKIEVLKVKTERKPIDFIAVKGSVARENVKQSVKSKISITNITTQQPVGTFEAEDNGNFNLTLPNGAKLLYTVETPGLKTQSQGISLPMATVGRPFKQTVTYENGILKIINNFEEAPTDDSYLQYLKLIEEKAKLDPNEGKNKLSTATDTGVDPLAIAAENNETKTQAANTNNPTPVKETKSTAAKETKTEKTTTATSGISKEMLDIAKQDATEAEKEYRQINQDANDAKEIGLTAKINAENKLKEAETQLQQASAISNETDKNTETQKALTLKNEAESELAAAKRIIELSDKLKEDAASKQKEAQLNRDYVNELEKMATAKKTDPNSSKKIESIQQQLKELENRKPAAEALYTAIKEDADTKEEAYKNQNEKTAQLRKEFNELEAEVKSLETELANTKKKKQKAEINTKIEETTAEKNKVEKLLKASEEEEDKLAIDYNSSKNQLSLTEKIKTEDFAKITEKPVAETKSETPVVANSNLSSPSKQLEEKYSGKISAPNLNDKNSLNDANKQLSNYNTEIDQQIAALKKDLTKTKQPAAQKSINTEIRNLEAAKKQNQQSIANNNTRIKELNTQQALAANNSQISNSNLKEISDENPSNVQSKLDVLKQSLNQSDNAYFNYNSYSNNEVQNTKIKADQEINEAYALQNKLKETIKAAEANIQAASVNLSKNSDNPDALYKQSDELQQKAQNLRNEAAQKQGNEKNTLLQQASMLERQSEEKQIQASESLAKQTLAKTDVNKENINTLINAGKSDQATIAKAKQLLEESDQAIKQSKAIREEANAMNNNAAKIGSYGNAEEKEAIALNKQNEAIALLQKSDTSTPLKAYEEKGSVTISNEAIVKEELAKINTELKEVLNTKNKAYESLTTANTTEINEQNFKLRSNETIASTPALKSEFVAVEKSIQEITVLQEKVNQTEGGNEKLVALNALAAKQNEVLNALNKLNNNVANTENTIAANKSTAENKTESTNKQESSQKETANQTAATSKEKEEPAKQETLAKNTTEKESPQTESKPETKQSENQTAKLSKEQANTVFAVDLSADNHKDTSISKVNAYFAANNFVLNNNQANNMKENALNELSALETSYNVLIQEINNAPQTNDENALSNSDIKNKIDNLSSAADNLQEKADDLRNEASEATEPEKGNLLAQAKQMEDKAFSKKVEAAQLTQQYNQANYNANYNAINDLIEKAGNKDKSFIATAKAKLEELEEKKKQAANMREEANALSSNAARFGAIGNAEEEEASILAKQTDLINQLKKYDPAYVVKEPSFNNINAPKTIPTDLANKQDEWYNKTAQELMALTNAYNLEFETNKNAIPAQLNENEKAVRANIFTLNNEAKKLLIQSGQTKQKSEKVKLLSLAAKTAHTAAAQLNMLITKQTPDNVARANNNIKPDPEFVQDSKTPVAKTTENKTNNTGETNKKPDATATNTTVKPVTEKQPATVKEPKVAVTPVKPTTPDPKIPAGTKVLARVEGLEVLNKDAYTDNKPIPIDEKMPDGLVFRVQIGAFKNRIANNSFRGLTPVSGETTPNGYIRYTAGNFNQFQNAAAVKNDLNRNGYPDAFVVAFLNGKRITILEAMEMLKNEGKTIPAAIPQTAGIKENVNPNPDAPVNVNTEEPVVVTKELEKTKNMLFTVQIGVYSRQISKARLSNLSPIYTEQLPNGLYRYTAGIYNSADRLIRDKNRVIDVGVKDAFVSAYLEGKRIPFNEAKLKKENDPDVQMEPENPIIFPGAGVTANTAVQPAPDVQPFTNNVKERPAPTDDNGVKADESGVSFKVQIGAYSRQVPADIAAQFNRINTWPVENKFINGLFIYNVGNFSDAKFAKALKDQMVALGITDAFVTVYRDGIKLFGAEASNLMNR
jgi:hypothetical protein